MKTEEIKRMLINFNVSNNMRDKAIELSNKIFIEE
jgi:hypothetical protein